MADHKPLEPLPLTPKPGRYRHYKGALYEVLGLVRHSEELAPYVLYRRLDPQGVPLADAPWVRPQSMWSEPIQHQGRTVPRFAPVE